MVWDDTLVLEGDASSQTDGAVAVDALLLIAAEEMAEVRVGRILIAVGGIDWQDLRLMARSSLHRLIHHEVEGPDVGKASIAAAAVSLIRRKHGVVEDVIDISSKLNCDAVIDLERLMHAKVDTIHGWPIERVPSCNSSLGVQVAAHAG